MKPRWIDSRDADDEAEAAAEARDGYGPDAVLADFEGVAEPGAPDPDPPEEVIAAVEALLDVAVARTSTGDETFVHCRVCGEWEGHTATCFVPGLLAWQAAP